MRNLENMFNDFFRCPYCGYEEPNDVTKNEYGTKDCMNCERRYNWMVDVNIFTSTLEEDD